MSRNLARRLARLEERRLLTGSGHLVVRFAGPGSDGMPQWTPDDENAQVLLVTFVESPSAESTR
jgi:hypothetical protein